MLHNSSKADSLNLCVWVFTRGLKTHKTFTYKIYMVYDIVVFQVFFFLIVLCMNLIIIVKSNLQINFLVMKLIKKCHGDLNNT